MLNIDLFDINRNIQEKSKNYTGKNNLINQNFNFHNNNMKYISKTQKTHENSIYVKFSVVSDYIIIIFIAQLFKKLYPKNWESKNE